MMSVELRGGCMDALFALWRRSSVQGLHHHYTAFDRVCKPCVAHRSLQNDARRIQCTSKTSRDARKRQQQSMQFNAVCVCDMSRRRGVMARASHLASRKCLLTLKSASRAEALGQGREAMALRSGASTTDEVAKSVCGHVFRWCVWGRGAGGTSCSARCCVAGQSTTFFSPQIDFKS